MRLSVNLSTNEKLRNLAVVNQLEKLDKALLNSAISYAVYTKNESWYESWCETRLENPGVYIPTENFVKKNENFKKDKLYDRAFAALIANKLNPAQLDLPRSDNHRSSRYLYDFDAQYDKGVYKALDNLSAATALTSKNVDGTNTLHVSFRGTDKDARPFWDFATKAYLDMAAYYDSFKPFEEAVLKFASDPNNRVTKIEVSGHSLGGAMVQHFLRSKEVAECKVPMQGFTYGSPPAVANEFYALFPAMRHIIRKGNVGNLVATIEDLKDMRHLERDRRITQYQHVGDIVPKVGNLLMEKTGQEIVTLKDRASKEHYMDYLLTGDADMKISKNPHNKFMQMMNTASEIFIKKPLRFAQRVGKTVYHDMARYTVNLDAQINEVKKANLKMINENLDINLRSLTPSHHSFNLSCQTMRLQYQSQARLLGFESDFNTSMEAGMKMEKMDFSKMLELRQKIMGRSPSTSLSYSKI